MPGQKVHTGAKISYATDPVWFFIPPLNKSIAEGVLFLSVILLCFKSLNCGLTVS